MRAFGGLQQDPRPVLMLSAKRRIAYAAIAGCFAYMAAVLVRCTFTSPPPVLEAHSPPESAVRTTPHPTTGGSRSAVPPYRRVHCGTDTCGAAEACCFGLAPHCASAVSDCDPSELAMLCDDAQDCPGNQVCCGQNRQFRCQAKCEVAGWQLCATDSECATGACANGNCVSLVKPSGLALPRRINVDGAAPRTVPVGPRAPTATALPPPQGVPRR